MWGDNNLKIGQWYTVKEASVRLFLGKTVLTTTPKTLITEASDAGPAVPPPEDDMERVSGKIISGNVFFEYVCQNRHSLTEVNTAVLVTKCEKCNIFCKTKNYQNASEEVLP